MCICQRKYEISVGQQKVCRVVKERKAGRLLGPLSIQEFPGVQVSQFGVIPKNIPGDWSLI